MKSEQDILQVHCTVPTSPSGPVPVAQSDHTQKTETETHDIYLVPPGEDTESCQSWIRMRNRDGRYNLMFEEWITDGPFIISPRITFEVADVPSCAVLLCG